MTEIGDETAYSEWADSLEKTRKIVALALRQALFIVSDLDPTLPEDHPSRISILMLSPEELSEIYLAINSRIRLDEKTMNVLKSFGVNTVLGDEHAEINYVRGIKRSHFLNHPNARRASTSREAFQLAYEAYMQAPLYEPPDRSLPILEEIFPAG